MSNTEWIDVKDQLPDDGDGDENGIVEALRYERASMNSGAGYHRVNVKWACVKVSPEYTHWSRRLPLPTKPTNHE